MPSVSNMDTSSSVSNNSLMEPAQKPKNKLECFQSTFNLGLQKLKENPNNDHR